MKALVGAFNQEKALVGAFSVTVQPVVEPMDHFTALVGCLYRTFSQADDPLAAELVGLVLPHRLDAHLEQVEVAVAGEVARLDQVAVDGPELLARSKPSYQLEILVKVMTLLAGTPPAVPETILGLEAMVTLRHSHGGEGERLHLQVVT